MSRDFALLWTHADVLLWGLLNTVWLSVAAGALSFAGGGVIASALVAKGRPARWTARVLVDALRCAPFLLFAYVIYYGLPSFGIRLSNWRSGLAALAIYNSAYMGEVLRGVWAELPRETIEAGHAFGFHGLTLLRRIILPPVMEAATPLLGNQAIQIVKDSALLTIIAVPELTHAANNLANTYFIPFLAFLAALALYWLVCLVIEGAVALALRRAQARR
jgi:polar amino acid transport system permease protein